MLRILADLIVITSLPKRVISKRGNPITELPAGVPQICQTKSKTVFGTKTSKSPERLEPKLLQIIWDT